MERSTVALVVAHLSFAGSNREKFAEFAEKKKVYHQNFISSTSGNPAPHAFFVMNKGDETLPIVQFADLASSPETLIIALPLEAMNIKMLSTLWLIYTLRRVVYKQSGFEIYVVYEAGKVGASGEVRYENWGFGSLGELLSKINSIALSENRKDLLEYVRGRYGWVDRPGGSIRLSNAIIKRALRIYLSKGGQGGSATLRAIKERIPLVKPYLPPGSPDSGVIPNIEKDIQLQIDILNQEQVSSEKPEPKPEPQPESKQPLEATPQPYATPQEAIVMFMDTVAETMNWNPDEVKLKRTPKGYIVVQ